MQRTIDAVLIKKILEKYQERYDECEQKWEDDVAQLKLLSEKQKTEELRLAEKEHQSFLIDDVAILNAQISAYECIVKDLKELIK